MLWHVYIIKCCDKTLYTGITKDLKRRINEHNDGRGCRYTSGRWPVELIYSEKLSTKSKALSRESQIKKLTRKDKLKLANKIN